MIKYIAADKGYIEMTDTSGTKYRALGAVGVSHVLVICDGVDDGAMHSSSMDFAKEYGFNSHGEAWDIFYQGVQDYAECK